MEKRKRKLLEEYSLPELIITRNYLNKNLNKNLGKDFNHLNISADDCWELLSLISVKILKEIDYLKEEYL